MFERFRETYEPDGARQAGTSLVLPETMTVAGFVVFTEMYSGVSFEGGMYRIHTNESRLRADELVGQAFPDFGARVYCFGYDWLGRQFSLDRERVRDGEPEVLMFEPGTGHALEIPAGFGTFHDVELVEYADACLAADFFAAWTAHAEAATPLPPSKCVGYQVPLFLGGEDSLNNLQPIDLQTYWELSGDLIQGVRDLHPGTTVGEVSIE